MNPEVLERIGLTRNESITYLTLLKLGTSKTGAILKSSGLNSGKIYEILDKLKDKGLVSETVENNTRLFTPAPPKQLIGYLEQKKNSLREEEALINEMIPALDQIREEKLPEKRIVTYKGFRGIVTAAEEALEKTEPGKEILSLGISDINAWSQSYWVRWEKMRMEKRVTGRYILSERGRIFNDLKNEEGIAVRFMKKDTPVGIDIYGDDIVLILHYQEPISCTMITDKNTVTTFKSYFDVLWKVAEP